MTIPIDGSTVPLEYLWLLALAVVPLFAWFSLRQLYLWLLRLSLRRRTDGTYQWFIMVTQYRELREQFRLRHWTRKRNGQTFYEWRIRREPNPLRRIWARLSLQPPRLELETDDEQLLSFAAEEWELPVPALTVRELMNARGYIFDGAGELVPLHPLTKVVE